MSLKDLPDKKQQYIKERLAGKSKTQAGVDAGYSFATARNAGHAIETPDVRREFAAAMRRRISAEKIAETIEAGLSAMETKFFQKDGKIVDTADVIAWGERRQYAALAAEYGGYFVPRKEVDVDVADDSAAGEVIRRVLQSGDPGTTPPADVSPES